MGPGRVGSFYVIRYKHWPQPAVDNHYTDQNIAYGTLKANASAGHKVDMRQT